MMRIDRYILTSSKFSKQPPPPQQPLGEIDKLENNFPETLEVESGNV